jgi:hypothetical protein
MPAPKFLPCSPEYGDATGGHILAGVIAHSFHDRHGPGVADAKTFAGLALDKRLSLGRAVEGHIPDYNVLLRNESGAWRRAYNDFSARESLADMIIGITLQGEGDSLREEGPEALPCRSDEPEPYRIVGSPLAP